MSLKIDGEASGRQVSKAPKPQIGVPLMKRSVRKHFMVTPRLRDQGWITPGIIPKYPYQTHIMRFPLLATLCVSFFSKYARKDETKRNFFETVHALPYRGIACSFWRTQGARKWQRDEPIRTLNHFFPAQDQSYHLRNIAYKNRPWRAKASGEVLMGERVLVEKCQPFAAVAGDWEYALPKDHRLYPHAYRPSFPLSNVIKKYEIDPLPSKIQTKK